MSFIPQDERSIVDMAKQSFKDECDIRNITRRYKEGAMVTHLAKGVPNYADVSEAGDLRTILDRVRDASEWFGRLPARVRERFDNDPAAFIDAANDPLGQDLLEELGLMPKGPSVVAVPQARNADGTFAKDANRNGQPD